MSKKIIIYLFLLIVFSLNNLTCSNNDEKHIIDWNSNRDVDYSVINIYVMSISDSFNLEYDLIYATNDLLLSFHEKIKFKDYVKKINSTEFVILVIFDYINEINNKKILHKLEAYVFDIEGNTHFFYLPKYNYNEYSKLFKTYMHGEDNFEKVIEKNLRIIKKKYN